MLESTHADGELRGINGAGNKSNTILYSSSTMVAVGRRHRNWLRTHNAKSALDQCITVTLPSPSLAVMSS
jgi:hypothetical protein